jgi:DNA-binding MarR family transcriptional regulator
VILTASPNGRDLVSKARRRRDVWLASRLAGLSPQERAALRAAAPILEKLSQS